MRVLYLYPRSRQHTWQEYQAGRAPNDDFHGLTYLAEYGIEATYDDNPRTGVARAIQPLQQLFARRTGMGFALAQTWRMRRQIKAADLVVTTADTSGLPVAWFKSLGLIKTPQVYISMGLTDRITGFAASLQRWYGRILTAVERVLVLGQAEQEALQALLKLPAERLFVVPYGVDKGFWKPSERPADGDFLLSVGSDSFRDYDTLLAAVQDVPLVIVTRQAGLHQRKLPTKVQLKSDLSWEELRHLYQSAKATVIALQNVNQTTGQTSALQALATGSPLVLSRIRGTWDEQLTEGTHCLYVTPNDAESLRARVGQLLDNPAMGERLRTNGRRYVEVGYNSERYAAVLAEHFRAVVDQKLS